MNSNGNPKLQRIMEQLEDRVLFDAVPDGGFLLQPDSTGESPLQPAQEMSVDTAQQADQEQQPRELILIDGNVENADLMIAEILQERQDRTLEVRLLDADQDGIDQISEILGNANQAYDAVHIISHGSEGSLNLGSSTLDAGSLQGYAGQFVGWADGLTSDADLMFYGCNLAGNEAGNAFVDALSTLTGADVAASDDLTGAAELGGDWDLEVTKGQIEARVLAFENWFGLLADFTPGTLTGVDIGPATDLTSPANWSHATGVGTYNNLVSEDGTNSGYSLTIATTGTLTAQDTDPASNTIPNHTNDLSGIDGSFYDNSGDIEEITLTWSGLNAGQEYAVYSFAHVPFNSLQTVEITGGNGTVTHADKFFYGNDLLVNGSVGNSGTNLEEFASVVTADTNGQIKITITSNYWAVVSGSAISEVSGMLPETTADVALVTEDTAPNPISGNVLDNDSSTSGALTVSQVNGATGNVGNTVAGNHGTLVLNSDGTYEYTLDNNDAAVQSLNQLDNIVYIGSHDGTGTGSSAQGQIEALNLTTGATSVVTSSPFVPYINGLAANADNNLAYYSDETTLYYWDATADTHHVIGDLTSFGIDASEGMLSGGGTYFNGSLYIGTEPDGGGPMVDIYELQLAADGKSVLNTTPLQVDVAAAAAGFPDVGGFGDLIISDGAIYGSTTVAGFWKYDLTSNVFEQITNEYRGQLAATEDGRIYSVNGTTAQQVDRATGQLVGDTLTTLLEATDASSAISAPQNPNSVLTESFTYTVIDSDGDEQTTTLTITIEGDNDPPQANDFATTVNQDSVNNPINIALPTDVDNSTDELTITFDSVPPNSQGYYTVGVGGAVVTNGMTLAGDQLNQLVFTPAAGYAAVVSDLGYTVTDPRGLSDTGVISITVNAAPTAQDNTGSVTEDTVLSYSGNVITDNDGSGVDVDPEGASLTVVAIDGSAAGVGASVDGAYGTLNVASDGSYTYDLNNNHAAVNALGPGDSLNDSFVYTIDDGSGLVSSATLTISIHGSNDAPTIATAIPDQASIDSESGIWVGVATHFADAEAGALTFTASNLPGGLSINSATGEITGTLDNDASQSGPYVVTVTATDADNASIQQTFVWSVTNPAPTAADNSRTTSENAALSGNVINDNDGVGVDYDPDGDALNVALVNGQAASVGSSVTGTSGGEFTINVNGNYTFAPGTDFDYLAAGETATTSVNYTVSDGNGGTDSATLSVTVTGTNDSPTANGTIPNQVGVDSTVEAPLDVSGFFADLDSSDTLSFSANDSLPAGLSIDSTTGIITGTYEADSSQSGPYTVVVRATDSSGAQVSQTFTWSVTNPGPSATDNDLSVAEGSTLTGNAMYDNDGSGVDTDVDGDSISVSAVNGQASNVNNAVNGTNGGTFSISDDGGYTFATGSDFEHLAAGETATTSVQYTISDGEGGTDTATVSVTVTGTNDVPTSLGLIPGQSGVDGAVEAPLDVSGFFADADASDTLTYDAGGSLPPGLSIDPATGLITGTYAADASQGGPYVVVITATDDAGASAVQAFNWSVTNPGPSATDNDLTTTENGLSLTGNVINDDDTHGVDSDVDGDSLVVSEVNGQAANIDAVIAGSNGGTFTIGADGSYTFSTGNAFDYLAAGETATTTVEYTISDGEGGTDSATVKVTVTGTNDVPTVVSTIPPQSGVDSTVISPLDVSVFFADQDTSDTLTFDAGTSLPPGLLIDANSGVISGTYAADASQGGPYVVTITAEDSDGATVQQSFSWAVTNPGPVANDDSNTTSQDASVSAITLDNDSDVDGDVIVVDQVDGDSSSVGVAVVGSNGGEFTIQSNGSYSFDPNGDFVSLAAGETATTSVTYRITDNQGGVDTATVTITVTGANDGPVADSSVIAVAEGTDNTPLGLQAPTDADLSDTLTITVTGLPTLGVVTLADGTPVVSGQTLSIGDLTSLQFDAPDSYDGAADAGEFTYTVTDGSVTVAGSTDITILQINDAPNAVDDTFTINEDGSVTLNVLNNDSDPENDTLTITHVEGQEIAPGGSVTISTGVVTLNADKTLTFVAAADYEGPVDFEYTITDRTATGDAGHALYIEASGSNGTMVFSVDLDNGEKTYVGDLPFGSTSMAYDESTSTAYFIRSNGDVYAWKSGTPTSTVAKIADLEDAGGGWTDTIPGANGHQTAAFYNGSLFIVPTEGGTGGDSLYRIDFSDPTTVSDVIKVADMSGNTVAWNNNDDVVIDQATGMLYGRSDHNDIPNNQRESFLYSYDLNTGDFTMLASESYAYDYVNRENNPSTWGDFRDVSTGMSIGQDGKLYGTSGSGLLNELQLDGSTSLVGTFPIIDSDGQAGGDLTSSLQHGAISIAAVNGTVVAVNDTPIKVGNIPNQVNLDADEISGIDVSSFFGDPDEGDSLTFTESGLPVGLVIDASTGIISGTIDNSASQLGLYTVTITAEDTSGETVQQTFTWSVSNPGPDAQDDSGNVTENANASGDVLTNDSDPDGDAITVSEVNGIEANVSGGVAGSNGGQFVVYSDGSYSFDPGSDFDYLAIGETATTSVVYTIIDGEGGVDSATLEITVVGQNDLPTATGTIPDQYDVDAANVSAVDVAPFFSDADATDSLIFSASGLPTGLSIDESTAVITGTVDNSASQSGVHTVTVTAEDSNGQSVTQTFSWTITNPGPEATDNLLGTSDGAVLNGNVMFDDDGNGLDNDIDGDAITVTEVNGQAANLGTAVSGSSGGVFTILSDGSYSFDTGTDFEHLGPGQTQSTAVTYTIDDGEGGTDSATVTVVVSGTNEAPTTIGTISPQTGVDGTVQSPLDVSSFFGDNDGGDVLSFDANGSLPLGLSIDSATGVITGVYDSDASQSGPYTVEIIATDLSGATATQTFTWAVTNPGPDATDNSRALVQNAVATGNVISDDNGSGQDTDVDGDAIVVAEVNGEASNVGVLVAGSDGGVFQVNADGRYSFDTQNDFDQLDEGQTVTTTLQYTISDGEGGTDTATVTIEVTGTNDAPTAIGSIPPQTGVDSTVVAPLNISGFFTDVDSSDTMTFDAGSTLPPGLLLNATTGVIYGTYDADSSQGAPYTVVITATDSSGADVSQSFTWSVDNPGPSATDNELGTTENVSLSGNVISDDDGSGIDTDVDGDVIHVSLVNGEPTGVGLPLSGTNGGSFVINSDGSYTFTPGSDFDYLAAGEEATTAINYTISDGQGGTDSAVVTVTVTGTNDTPTSVGTVPPQAGVDGTVEAPLDVSGFFADADATDSFTYDADGTLPPGLTLNLNTGIITGAYDSDASQGGPYSVVITATDSDGAVAVQAFTWTVTNPGPEATDNDLATTQGSTLSGNAIGDDNGNGVDVDVDGDAIAVTEVNGQASNLGVTVVGTNGGTFTISSNGSYVFDTLGDFDHLAAGETATTTVTYTISDGEGGLDTASVAVTVTGTNDAPTAVGAIPAQFGIDTTVEAPLDVSAFFSETDANDALTFDANGTLPAGLSIDPTTGVITGTYDADSSQSGPYAVVITATDINGESATQSFTWTVTNPGPEATDNAVATNEGAAHSGNVIVDNDGSGVDSDIDGDSIFVSEVNGQASQVGTSIGGSNGGLFKIDSDGEYSFDTGSDFDFLAEGETASTTISYTISDGEGGTDTAVVTVTVAGTNTVPTLNGTIPPQTGVDSTVISPLDLSGFFTDSDNASTLTFDAAGTLPPGLAIDPVSGTITGTYDSSASNVSPYVVTITATDEHGAAVHQTFDWTVTNPGPDAIDNERSGDQTAILTGNVITDNDGLGIDVDIDGDDLTVTEVNGSETFSGVSVAGTAGGLFMVSSEGDYSFDPNGQFDDLAAGESRTTSVNYQISDGDGGTDTAVLIIVVSGTNDAPTANGTIPPQAGSDGAVTAPLDVSGFFVDVDATDSLSFDAGATLPPGLSIDSETGVITGVYTADASQGGPYNVVVTATDGSGDSVTQAFQWTVDNPGPTALDDHFATAQDSVVSGNIVTDDNAHGIDHDIDGDTITVASVNGSAAGLGSSIIGTNGGTFVVNANGSYSFDTGNDFDNLAVGETRTTEITYTITDGEGGASTATVSVTVTGTNDNPFTVGDIPAQSDVDSVAITSLDVSQYFGDLDTSDSLSFDAADSLPPGLSIDSATGVISGTPDPDASNGGPYTVTIIAEDTNGDAIAQTFVWHVSNPGPVAADDDFITTQGGTLAGDVMSVDNGNGVDADVDGDPITVQDVNGNAGNLGVPVAGSNGGTFIVNSDGSYQFNAADDFNELGVGESVDTTIAYTITDGDKTSSATVTVTVQGTNDAPITTALIPDQVDVDSVAVTPVNVSGFFTDVDATDALTFDANGSLPTGLALDAQTGVISGTPTNSASQGGPYTVTITAIDGNGGSVSQSFTWSISNPGPDATDNTLGVSETSTTLGNLVSDDNGSGVDSDPDGDTLTVTEINGVVANVGAVVAGSNGGTFTVLADGSYTFATGNDFQYLNVGETATTTVTYTISDGDGGSDSAQLIITVAGVAAQPQPNGTIPPQAGVDATVTAPLNIGPFFSDADATDTLTFNDNGTLPDGLSIDPVTGLIGGTYDSSSSANGPYTVVITATDSTGNDATQTFQWTVSNPGPVATDNDLSTTENATLSGNVITDDNGNGIDTDIDGDQVTVSQVNGVPGNVGTPVAGSTGGVFTILADGSYTFTLSDEFDSLAAGEIATTSVSYQIVDADGATDTATVVVNVTGTNDLPTNVGTIPPQIGVDSTATAVLDVSSFFDDADDALSFDDAGTLPPGLTIDGNTGQISGTFDSDASQSGPYTVEITATDAFGEQTTQSFAWNVNNPGPVAADNDLGAVQGSTSSGNVMSDSDGHGIDDDIDGDAITVVAVNGQEANLGAIVRGSDGGTFVINSDGTYTFDTLNDFDSLAAGETLSTSVEYTISDDQGGFDTATVFVTVTGTNDIPTSIGSIPDQIGVDSTVESPLDISGYFSDVDGSDLLSYDAAGSLPAGLTIDPNTGVITGTYDADASQGGPYAVVITATDGAGASVTQTFNWSVNNPGPVATDNDLTTPFGTVLTGNVMGDDDGNGTDADIDGDAISVTEVNGQSVNVGAVVAGSNGGVFTISADGSYTFNTLSDFDHLGTAQILATTIDYTISDGEGGESTATVTVVVSGLNQAPTAEGTIPPQVGIDGTTTAPLNVSGFFGDIDNSAGDVLTFSAGSTLPLGLTIDPTSGVVTGTYQSDASQSGPYTVIITATDIAGESVTQSFTWSVSNPGPEATDNELGTTENFALSGNVLADDDLHGLDRDVDGDTLVVSEVNGQASNIASSTVGSNGGVFTIQADGRYDFDPLADFEHLAIGETTTTTIEYTISDGQGGTDTATVTVTVTGTNDSPTVNGTIPDQIGIDSTVEAPLDVSGFFGDLDATDALTFDAEGTLPDGLRIDPVTGVITGAYTSDASQNGPYTVLITATDPQGATVSQTFTWDVTNPGPDATNNDLGTLENASLSGNVMDDNDGAGIDSDVDGDAIFVSKVNGQTTNVGTVQSGSNGGNFIITSDGNYSFTPGADFDHLNAGETSATAINYTISDGQGGTDSATVTVIVTGTNDVPTTVGEIAPQVGVDGTVSSPLNISGYFVDTDISSTLTFDDNGTLPGGLSIDPSTGLISGTFSNDSSQSGPYTVLITATDDNGATATLAFTWSVSNPGPDATDNEVETTQGSTLSGNVISDDDGNGIDSDVDGDAIIVSEINGQRSQLGVAVYGTNGGTFVISSDGSYSFDTGSDFDYLAAGEVITTTVDYTVSDGEGGTDTAILAVTITGTNDTPETDGTIPPQSGSDGTVESPLDVSGFFSDVDLADSLSFDDAGTLPPGLTIDPNTGVITGAYASDASRGGPYSVVITADDGNGGNATQTFVWNVANPTPTASNDGLSTDEDTPITGQVISANNGQGVDSDPDGDDLSVAEVNEHAGNVGTPVAGSNGGVFTVNADGTFQFDPAGDFTNLASGESAATSVTYTITDHQGGSDTATVTVTVNGNNETPVTTGAIPSQDSQDSDTIAAVDVSVYFTDADTTNTLTYSDAGTLPPGLVLDASTGVITGTIENDASTAGPFTVTITADDGNGGTATQAFTWSVSNPGPAAFDNTDTVSDGGATSATGNVINDSGSGLIDNDPDGDSLSISQVNATSVAGPVDVPGTHGILSTGPNGDYTYDLDINDPVVTALGDGETLVDTFDYTISDGQGGTDTATLTVTIIGTNDGPTAIGSIPDRAGADGMTIPNVPTAIFFGDPDATDTLTFSDNGTLPPGITIDPTTGVISGTYTHDASTGSAYPVVITATDSSGEIATQSFIWNVSNPVPTAVDDVATTDQNTPITINVITNNDSDTDGDTLTIQSVNESDVLVGNPTAGTNGGIFTIVSDGTTTFDPGSDFDELTDGESVSTEVTYTVTDSDGATSTATVSIVVSGTDDAPTTTSDLPVQESIEGEPITPVDLSEGFTDVDSGDTLTFNDNGTLPPGLVVDPTTGIVTGTPAPGTAEVENFEITITATDTTGKTATQTFTWNITSTFVFDSFRDFSGEEKDGSGVTEYGDHIHHREVVLSKQIENLASEPILAGYASPGAVLIGRIYDSSGSIVGETNLTVGPSGNWTMHFFGTRETTHTRVVIEHVATENVALGNSALKLTDDTYRALQLDAASKPSSTAGTILDGTASRNLDDQDGQNLNPLGLL